MAITTFIPKVWSAKLLESYERAMVIGALCNRNYEGDIAQWGDTVHINSLANLTVKEYTPNTDIDNPEQLTTTDQTLVIDHGAYFNFYINDVDAAQARADLMEPAMRNAAQRLAEDTEDYIVQKIISEAGISETGELKAGTVYEALVALKTKMDEKNVPKTGRYLVVPPAIEGEMLLDSRFITANGQASENRLVNGSVARAAGFDIFVSNALTDKMLAFNQDCVTFARQITKTEAYRREKGFDDGVKGLSLCGAKVVLPQYTVVYTLTGALAAKASEPVATATKATK